MFEERFVRRTKRGPGKPSIDKTTRLGILYGNKSGARSDIFKPQSVFEDLKTDKKWIPADIFMALLLGVFGFIKYVDSFSIGQLSPRNENQSAVEFTTASIRPYTSNSKEASDRLASKSVAQNADTRVVSSQLGKVALSMFMSALFIPVAFGFLCVLFLLEAIYFRIVSGLLHLEFKLRDWFLLTAWSRVLAVVLSVVAVIVGLATVGREPSVDDSEVHRLTHRIKLPESHYGGRNWSVPGNFDHFDALLIWVIVLQTIGF